MDEPIDDELVERISKVIAAAMYNDPYVFESSMWAEIKNDISLITLNTLKSLKPGDSIGNLVVVPHRPTEMMSKTFAKNAEYGGAFEDNYTAMIAATQEYS